jgi:hypothetical protein
MKRTLLILIVGIGSVLVFAGCEDEVYIVRPDYTPPSVPKGLYSVTADEAVYLYWYENDESDFKEYRVYRYRVDVDEYYYRIATTTVAEYVDRAVKNGATYVYAVTARDRYGNESDFSDTAFDTPRPEGFDWVMYDRFYKPSLSGFDFSEREILHWEDDYTDIFLEYDDYLNVFFLCAANYETDIQDFGYTDDLDDIDWSPLDGWSNVGWVEVIKGHSYIIWTWNDHYAKFRVNKIIGNVKIYFDWAYQIDPANRELAPKPPHGENYLRVATREPEDAER